MLRKNILIEVVFAVISGLTLNAQTPRSIADGIRNPEKNTHVGSPGIGYLHSMQQPDEEIVIIYYFWDKKPDLKDILQQLFGIRTFTFHSNNHTDNIV